VFVFRNRRATAIKVLIYDGQGFWLAQKRLSESRFRWWVDSEEVVKSIAAHEAAVLFSAGNPNRTGAASDWRSVSPRKT
jgi:transposase